MSDKWLNIENFQVDWEDNSNPLAKTRNLRVPGSEETSRACLKVSLGVKELTEGGSFILRPMDLWFAGESLW